MTASLAPSPSESADASTSRSIRAYDSLPSRRGVPIFGNALQMDLPRVHQQLEAWSEELGPVFRLTMPGVRILVVADHELVAAVLRNRPDGFWRGKKLQVTWVEMGLPVGLFIANGDVWQRQRRMVMAGFAPAHVKSYYPAMLGVAARLSARWRKAVEANQAIELQPDLMRYTVDTIAGLAFGAQVDTLGSDGDVIQRHLDQIFPALWKRLLMPFPIWRWLPRENDRKLAHAIAQVNAAVSGFVVDARARLEADPSRRKSPPNLLEAMIVAADEPSSGIDDHQVAGNVMTMLLAGEDTTANTLAWMFHLMWQNPATLARAIEEVQRVVGDDLSPSIEQMARLEYVEACAHESMRLRPVAPLLAGQAKGDQVVGDIHVPDGVLVYCVMRRDSVSDAHLPHAAAFMPERWLSQADTAASGATTANSVKRISMPFGAGPRICPGRYLALLEMKLAIATVLRDFEIASVDTPFNQPAQEVLKFAMAPVGLSMRLRLKAQVTAREALAAQPHTVALPISPC